MRNVSVIIFVCMVMISFAAYFFREGRKNMHSISSTSVESALTSVISKEKFEGVVFVSQGSQVIFKHVYGKAQPPFMIGSVTKIFTAAAVATLIDKGFIKNVHDAVNHYLPEFAHKDVTIYHLLTHTSGMPLGGIPSFRLDENGYAHMQCCPEEWYRWSIAQPLENIPQAFLMKNICSKLFLPLCIFPLHTFIQKEMVG